MEMNNKKKNIKLWLWMLLKMSLTLYVHFSPSLSPEKLYWGVESENNKLPTLPLLSQNQIK